MPPYHTAPATIGHWSFRPAAACAFSDPGARPMDVHAWPIRSVG